MHIFWAQKTNALEAQTISDTAVLDSLPDPLLMIDRSGNILGANLSARTLFGKSVTDKNIENLFNSESFNKSVSKVLNKKSKSENLIFYINTPIQQKLKAKETLDILTPIAHRLGIGSIKSELEDLSLRYYKPDVYFEIVEKLNRSKAERDQLIIEMKQSVSNILNEHDIKHEIKGRAKSIFSIYKKLDKGKKFSDIYDLLALRVFVDSEAECYQALGIIHAKYRPIPKRFKDYVAMPKTNMYQSLHTTVFGEGGQLYEIQIRTPEMDQIAELGIASHWSYKEKGSNVKASMKNTMEQKLQFFRNIMDLQKDEATDEEFVKSVSEDILKENIYVFTPKGDVIELPVGATPIDFAYRVHSGVGDKMVGAIVNNNIVSLDYKLHDNDIIKINTNKNSIGPSREWINMAYTSQAKNKIRSFFNKIDKEGYLKKGEDSLREECRKKKVPYADVFNNETLEKITKEFKFNSLEELYMNIGSGKLTPTTILNSLNGENATKAQLILNKASNNNINNNPTHAKNDVVVEGIDDIKGTLLAVTASLNLLCVC